VFRLLVLSDTHGCIRIVKAISDKNSAVNGVLHLGDGFADAQEVFPDLPGIYSCKGNCDVTGGGFPFPEDIIIQTIENVRFTACHGDAFSVKNTLRIYLETVRKNNCKIGFYGHTHIQKKTITDDVVLVNPGRGMAGEYCIAEFSAGQVNFLFFNL